MFGRNLVFLIVVAFGFIGSSSAIAHPPAGIVVNQENEVFFCDFTRSRIMKFSEVEGLEVFFDGAIDDRLSVPHHLTLDDEGNIYSIGDHGGRVIKIKPEGSFAQVYPKPGEVPAIFLGGGGDPISVAADGSIYGVEYKREEFSRIVRITHDGVVERFLGGTIGHRDGLRKEAQIGGMHGSAFAWGPDGSLYFTDSGKWVRRVTKEGVVSTIAGDADGTTFRYAVGLAILDDGSIVVAEYGANRVRRVDPQGNVALLAGTGERGGKDGPSNEAMFDDPSGVAIGPGGSLYVLDFAGRDTRPRVRRISKAGIVSTLVIVDEDSSD